MKTDKDMIKRLRFERLRRIQEASRKLVEERDLEALKRELAWIHSYSQLLQFSLQKFPNRRLRFIWSIIIAFLCLLIVGLAWTLHIRTAQVSFEIVTQNVTLTLGKDWLCNRQFSSDRIFINNIVKISAPGLNPVIEVDVEEKSVSMDLQGEEITVNELFLLANANVELNVQGDKLKLFVKDSALAGELFLQRADLILEMEEETIKRSVDSEIPETISFRTAKTGADPAQFELATGRNWQLRGLHVQAIGFLEEFPPGSCRFKSAIRSGKVTLLETRLIEDLREEDSLILKDAKSRRLEISKGSDCIRVFFEGSVAKILAGPQSSEKDLTPTYLEYLYHQKRLTFFWSAVVFLWGILWSIRNGLLN